MSNNVKPNMEIVEIDGTPVDQEEEVHEEVTETKEKRGFFKTVGHAIAAPFKFVGRKIKENPGSAAVGGVIGGATVLGAKFAWDHFVKGRHADDEEECIESEDLGEESVEAETDDNIDEAM